MTNPLVLGERRLYERKACLFRVGVTAENGRYQGLLRNLSAGGALVESLAGHAPRIGQEVVLTIPFREKRAHAVLKGRIAADPT